MRILARATQLLAPTLILAQIMSHMSAMPPGQESHKGAPIFLLLRRESYFNLILILFRGAIKTLTKSAGIVTSGETNYIL